MIMNWRDRTVSDELDVKGTQIVETYLDYEKGHFWVNRKYQRKLVWEREEKQYFIDTILHRYPVPVFLLVRYKLKGDDFYRRDIVDGLQRFDSIFSFIENQFPVKWDGKWCYFNVSALAGGEQLVRDGRMIQKSPALDFDTSRRFLTYTLPTTITEADDDTVDEIFTRINSTGRKLSNQDLRQAGVTGEFSKLIRKTSCYIRGDFTEEDLIPLSSMQSLSLSNKGLNYGINLKDSFWIRHGILTCKNVRLSHDEEVIVKLYSYILKGGKVPAYADYLNKIYQMGSNEHEFFERIVTEKGVNYLMNEFSKVLNDFNQLFQSVHSNFSCWLFSESDVKGKSKVFQALFLTLYELRKDSYVIKDYRKAANALHFIGDKEFMEITTQSEWNIRVRNASIRRFKSILEKYTVLQIPSNAIKEWEFEMERLIMRANGVEGPMYDFKLGIIDLKSGRKNKSVISKSIQTLTAMANTLPGKIGTVIFGIANDENSAENFKQFYNANYLKVGECYLTGIDNECRKYWKDLDDYLKTFKDVINTEPVSETVKRDIINNISTVTYKKHIFVLLSLCSCKEPVVYADTFYERLGSHNEKINGASETTALFNRFKNQ